MIDDYDHDELVFMGYAMEQQVKVIDRLDETVTALEKTVSELSEKVATLESRIKQIEVWV